MVHAPSPKMEQATKKADLDFLQIPKIVEEDVDDSIARGNEEWIDAGQVKDSCQRWVAFETHLNSEISTLCTIDAFSLLLLSVSYKLTIRWNISSA